jgi:hypothetical protein
MYLKVCRLYTVWNESVTYLCDAVEWLVMSWSETVGVSYADGIRE